MERRIRGCIVAKPSGSDTHLSPLAGMHQYAQVWVTRSASCHRAKQR